MTRWLRSLGERRAGLPGYLLLAVCAVLWSCTTGPPAAPGAQSQPAVTESRPTPAPAREQPASTTPRPVLPGTVLEVIDGDTVGVQLSSGPVRVRLHSIDAPERTQPWFAQSRDALARRVAGRSVGLDVFAQDRYDRLVAVILLGDDNVNAWMVQQGHAWAYRHYLEDPAYCIWEFSARSAQRGLWSLPPQQRRAPWEWRAVERGESLVYTDYGRESVANCVAAMRRGAPGSEATAKPAPPAQAPPGDCRIKGNVSENGRIYHVPGSRHYELTTIDESRGERWFCTADEARRAGWRPPRN